MVWQYFYRRFRLTMATMLYQGHGSFRLTTDTGKVIYIDPFAGSGYDLPADLILVTHQHHDHNCIDLPAKKPSCVIWQSFDALNDGKYNTLSLDFAKVESVEAYNHHHKKEECVGYIITVDGKTIYFAGDTGETSMMPKLAERKLNYAVLPMDYTYTMDIDETIRCAKLIAAEHTIPSHMSPGKLFDMERAKKFTAPGALIVRDGESIRL